MADQVKYTQKLKGDKVLVIGGSSGIGYAVSEAAAENGCKVIVSSSNPSRVEQTVQKLQKAYPSSSSNISGHVCNLGDESKIEQNIIELFEKTGKVDHIIYTAADALAQMPLDTIDLQKIQKQGCSASLVHFSLASTRRNISHQGRSPASLTTGGVSQRPIPDWTVIGSYATALHGLTRGLALDLKPIRVNLVSPGAVDTELWANSGFNNEQKEGMFKGIASKLPTGRVPGPEEIAESYVYLLRDHNITGTMVSTNGGSLLV